MATIEKLWGWISRDLERWGTRDKVVEVVENHYDPKENENVLRFRIYTDNNKYSIVARERLNFNEKSYLGCIATSRKPRAGEDWCRGNDLLDGEFTEFTWLRILADIVSYELVKVNNKPKEQKAVA